MGLHRSTTCPSSDSVIPSSTHCYTPLSIKLSPLQWEGQMQQEYRHLQDKAKAIEMERVDVARVYTGFSIPESGVLQVESDANIGLHRSTTCPSSDSDDPLNTLLNTLEDKAKVIPMERADAARV